MIDTETREALGRVKVAIELNHIACIVKDKKRNDEASNDQK